MRSARILSHHVVTHRVTYRRVPAFATPKNTLIKKASPAAVLPVIELKFMALWLTLGGLIQKRRRDCRAPIYRANIMQSWSACPRDCLRWAGWSKRKLLGQSVC